MTTLPYYVIPKWEGGKDGNPILFFPDASANPGNMLCYVHMGQHSEASLGYYRSLRNVRPDKKERVALAALLREYKGFLDKSEYIEIVRRDSKRFQKTRYAYLTRSKISEA